MDVINMVQHSLDEWLKEEEWLENIFKGTEWQLWQDTLPLAKSYIEIKVPKKGGGFRIISIPSERLKEIQREILRFLKTNVTKQLEINGLHHGSHVEHARFHSKSRFIFQFDVKDAFPSVKRRELRKFLLMKIADEDLFNNEYEVIRLADLILGLTTFKETIPQGAPTSPFMFYAFLLEKKVIQWIYKCCFPNCEVSCYVDNFAISSPKPILKDTQEKIISTLEEIGLKINKEKVWFRDCRNGNVMITGISIDGKGRVSLPKKRIRRWRGIIHRATFETDPEKIEKLKRKIEGFIASLRPIYGEKLPSQIAKPYLFFKSKNKPA
jgi:hypothetical protein